MAAPACLISAAARPSGCPGCAPGGRIARRFARHFRARSWLDAAVNC